MSARVPSRRWLKIAEGLLNRPTATFLEDLPQEWVRAFAAGRDALALEEDRWGNLLLKYPARRAPKTPPLVMVAHLDHPGFVVKSVRGDVADLEFRGGVRRRHVKPGQTVDFYRPGKAQPVGRGRVTSTSQREGRPGMIGGGKARITQGTAEAGCFTMWRFPGYAIRGKRIVSRCLDDLLGAAAALCTLDEMIRQRPRGAHVWGYFTRAEEVGLFGALAGIHSRVIPKDARVLSLETSRALPHARQGDGVLVRVGDRGSLFDPALMDVLNRVATAIGEDDPAFRFQRRLMDGGSCEASAFCAAGYRAGGLAVPLGNYHNMKGLDGGPVGIGPETVAVSDYVDEVRLLVHLAAQSGRLPKLERETTGWMERLTAQAIAALGRAS
ncbi:hypothetical protein K8I85_04415 [bacterium]|nr:hypothetical protein [bacterium]